MTLRPYQHKYTDNIEIGRSNLLISPMRSGKSIILKSIIDKYFLNKRVLILVGMRNIVTQLSEYFDNHSMILSGHTHNHDELIHLGSFQTLQRRDIDLSQYSLICVDEAHMRYNTAIVKEIRALSCTRLFMTGTPLKPNGRFLDNSIDNIMEFIDIKQMLSRNYLAPTRFISRANIIGDESELSIRNGDYDNADIDRVIDKHAVVQWIIDDNKQHKWSTEHKCIMYVNSIATANRIVAQMNDPINCRVIHSKLSKSELDDVTNWYESTDHGIIVNCRMLTIGYDSASTDTILYLTPTKLVSLLLQSVWRGSTLDPNNPNKVATVYDYSGVLTRMNPYFNDWQGAKPTCKEACKEFPEHSMEYYACLASCTADPILQPCDGKLSATHSMNPYVKNFRIISGEPCGESLPAFRNKYKSVDSEDGIGLITKYTKCGACGCVTAFDIETITQPTELIELFSNEVERDTAIILYSREHKAAIAILDCKSNPRFKIFKFTSSKDLYTACVKFFPGTFQVTSNIKIPILPNVFVDRSMDDLLPLITNWESDNKGIVRKLIKFKYERIAEFFGMRAGMAYYAMKSINTDNEKQLMKELSRENITRSEFLKLHNKLSKDN